MNDTNEKIHVTEQAGDDTTAADSDLCFTPEEMKKMMQLVEEKDKLIEEKTKTAEEFTDRYQRLQADFENFRRRTRLEKEELSILITEGVVSRLLPVIDNFERALASDAGQDTASVLEGVELIYRQLMNTLEKMDLKPIQAVGECFDPRLHEAVMRVEENSQPDGTITEEFQKGYMLGDKVIRPSMVKVIGNA